MQPAQNPRVIEPGHTYASVTDKISSIVLSRKQPKGWYFGFAIAFALLMLLTYAVTYGWIDVQDVVAGIKNRAPKTNVVITGRDAAPELIEIADTVTEMRKVKHAYDQGIKARKGIEF